ncbi:hypothetical protein NQ317_018817 [Molorchus minor]|uniref:Uncharacterized protein n=1 Tax=Molorchus minor TaxID=1323400 RepID=A0ABQ9JQ93_9CUCU|nr:hypothetical protein NQ317_018817 [Molorchus minor]
MGNLQTSDSKPVKGGKSPGKPKTKIKLRGKKGKAEELLFTSVVPEKEHASDSNEVLKETSGIKLKTEQKKDSDNVLVTDSWCKANKVNTEKIEKGKKKSAASPSSSDSNFTDPLTPVGFSSAVNACYHSEENVHLDVEIPNSTLETFLHDITLNSFKLNEYRARHEEEKCKKLSKLGVSKISQISLDSNPNDCFATDNVEVISKGMQNDSGIVSDSLEKEDTLKGRSRDSMDSVDEYANDVPKIAKRMSDAGLANGKYLFN